MVGQIISELIRRNIPFCVFSLPNKPFQIFVEAPDSNLNENSLSYFQCAPFDDQKFPTVHIASKMIIDPQSDQSLLLQQLERITAWETQPNISAVGQTVYQNEAEYLSSLTRAIEGMSQAEVDKFIYARIAHHTQNEWNVWDLLQKLNDKYPATLTYYFQHAQTGCWMGATPETLGQWNGGNFQTMSLAGTMRNYVPLEQWGEKEREEQQIVTAYIEEVFQKQNIPYHTQTTQVVQAGPVFHLKSEITSQSAISFDQAQQLITQLHPTPAICGLPLQRAQRYINEHEQHERAYYTGYLGVITPEKEVTLFVNLRCMQVRSNGVDLYLGGGITQKSNAASEWAETQHKARTLLAVLPHDN